MLKKRGLIFLILITLTKTHQSDCYLNDLKIDSFFLLKNYQQSFFPEILKDKSNTVSILKFKKKSLFLNQIVFEIQKKDFSEYIGIEFSKKKNLVIYEKFFQTKNLKDIEDIFNLNFFKNGIECKNFLFFLKKTIKKNIVNKNDGRVVDKKRKLTKNEKIKKNIGKNKKIKKNLLVKEKISKNNLQKKKFFRKQTSFQTKTKILQKNKIQKKKKNTKKFLRKNVIKELASIYGFNYEVYLEKNRHNFLNNEFKKKFKGYDKNRKEGYGLTHTY